MTFWVAGAAVVGAGIGAYSSNKAAKGMQDSADNATALQQGIYDDTVSRNQPFVSGGTTAFNALLGRLGLAGADGSAASGYGTLGHVPTAEEVMATPGYQFGMDQGQQALNRQLTASGWGGSGAAAKAAARYGTDYATTKYNNAFNNQLQGNNQVFNQLQGVAQLGQQSANNTSAYGSQFGQSAGENTMFGGAAQAAGTLAQGNIWGNALNQGVSAYKNAGSGGNGGSGVGWNGNGTGLFGTQWGNGYGGSGSTMYGDGYGPQ